MLTFCNVFGVKPTKNFDAAGYDFYIPNINDNDAVLINSKVIPALCKSYGLTETQLRQITDFILIIAEDKYYADTEDECTEKYREIKNTIHANKWNSCLLLLSMSFKSNLPVVDDTGTPISYNIAKFVYDNLVVDTTNGVTGILLHPGETLFINSGVKEKLPEGYAGVFMNKSGRGSSGYDVRACVVDEDYTGYVHLNLQFQGQNVSSHNSEIYCGDKIVQQLILPLYKDKEQEVNEEDFIRITSDSKRGDSAFGSSNEKH